MRIRVGQRLTKPYRDNPLSLYRALRSLNPSPYMYYYNFRRFPWSAHRQSSCARKSAANQIVTIRPLAGTRPRNTPERDAELATELLNDPKEIAEHVMLIDLARNDVGRIAEIGSVHVTDQMVIEKYSHVQHIVSSVEGKLKPGMTNYDVLRATFPAGTLSGAPKVRAMELIDELEPVRARAVQRRRRLSFSGEMDLAIAIRTGLIHNGNLYVQAAAGVVADSVPESEWQDREQGARGAACGRTGGTASIATSDRRLTMLLMIDNYDSFTATVQYFGELGEDVRTCNDEITLDEIARLNPDAICLSPGPSNPQHAGITLDVLKGIAGRKPILGVCLGHQAIGEAFGGRVVRAKTIMHGKVSKIETDCRGVFADLPKHFDVALCSLAIERGESLPDCLEVSAWTDDGEIMGVRHKNAADRRRAVPPGIDPVRAWPRAAREFPETGPRARAQAA